MLRKGAAVLAALATGPPPGSRTAAPSPRSRSGAAPWGVSRSGYDARAERSPGDAARRRETPAARVREVHAEMAERYGSPRLAVEPDERGVPCCVSPVAKVLRPQGTRAKTANRFVRTADSTHRLPVAANARGRGCSPARPHAAGGMAITHIPTVGGRLPLALVADLSPRRIAGRAMAATVTRRLVAEARDMAVRRRSVTAGRVAHPGRGGPYASERSRAERRRHGMAAGRSGVGQWRDNAVVESPFGGLKRELAAGEAFATREQARAAIFESPEVLRDRVRRHSPLGHVAAAEHERTQNPNLR